MTALGFHFISRLPRANNNFSHASHRLRITTHHGDGTHVL